MRKLVLTGAALLLAACGSPEKPVDPEPVAQDARSLPDRPELGMFDSVSIERGEGGRISATGQLRPGMTRTEALARLVAATADAAKPEPGDRKGVERRAVIAALLAQLAEEPADLRLGDPEGAEAVIARIAERVRHAPQFVSLRELAGLVREGRVAIVDARADGPFVGWPSTPGGRGGHVPGAVQVDPAWCRDPAWAGALARAPLPAGKHLIAVADDPEDARLVARALRDRGRSAGALEGSFREWAADPSLPLEACPNWQGLVDPRWVHDLVSGKSLFQRWRVLDVAWQDPSGWKGARVPGALFFDTNWVESPPLWNFLPAEQIGARLAALGIDRETVVVVYARQTMAATWIVLALRWWGVEDVRLMNGGLAAWQRAGLPVESGGEPLQPECAKAAPEEPRRPELIQSTADAKRILADPGAVLVSVRSWAEQCGETSGYDDIAARGRIRGDVWGHGGSCANRFEDLEDEDGTLRSPVEVQDLLWAPWGIEPSKQVSFYCGTGWRASQAWFVAWLLGWPRAGVYDGGWKEWTLAPGNPTATGRPTVPVGAPAPR